MNEKYMKLALELAKKGEGRVNPNPLVGAVIVKDNKIIGEGYHGYYGGPHAEINAFSSAKENVEGSTMYVTLEPCCHYGKTPPCVNAIIKNNIKKVIVGMLDPNPRVAGKGVEILREHGIEVITGVLEEECKNLNEIFIKYIGTKLPFVIMKYAMTLDGKIAAFTGDSKWITGEAARKEVHKLRNKVSGIMVGIGTVLQDNPSLTCRMQGGISPKRIIVDSNLRIPLNSSVLNIKDETLTIVATTKKVSEENIQLLKDKGVEVLIVEDMDGRVNLQALIKKLGEMGIDSILLEGGSTLNYSAIEQGIVDKVQAYIAPKIIGGESAKTPIGGEGKALMSESIILQNVIFKTFDEDILIEGYVK
ncbi:diaminohydroxyphosphoribosylaminopyrimidine deaminase/5-amino-6-(5-phosphoribosylamino)uracil reductase [Clostridium pascui]|uniref:bifunctional diaminohydroxyphosphoribosylaminopyrimidine deaminase/5-amino-6-(5-phosphoribosylamino)uracil reductase RibD n=1 Tax=Clostridium pascui TaxID=46609 RepID=UPI00195A3DEC|nr:diaminohydroxyphosphoribosylaminopyrimidine deaminase/5-amino-6-(5-phosphoribosylamino)uracil reductase [Clostridium pascui]